MLKNDNNNDNKKGLNYTIAAFAIVLLVVLIMINLTPISEFVSIVFSIIAPIALGAAIAYCLNPILKFLEFMVFKRLKSKKAIRILSLILTYIYAILIIALLVAVVAPQLTQSIIDLGKNYNLYIDTTINSINSAISSLSVNFDNIDVSLATETASEILTESGDLVKTILSYVLSYGQTLITTLKNLVLGLFISIYILASKEHLYAQSTKVARAFMSNKMFNNCMRYIRVANSTFGRFFIGKFFDSTIVFIISLASLAILDIPHAMLISIIIGILNIIPFFGIIIAIVFSAFIVLIASPEKFIAYIIVMIIIQQIDANIIAPKILGSSAGISSLGVIIAVIIMGSYFGIIGMIIGVPIFAIIIAILKEWIEKTLSKKNLPINTAEYYYDPDYSSESEEYKSITRIILDPILKKVSSGLNQTITRDLKKEDITEEETEDSQDDTNDNDNSN